jgi:hypothetical protein
LILVQLCYLEKVIRSIKTKCMSIETMIS